MSTSTPEVIRRPSAKTVIGLFTLVVGYLGALVGTVFYTWAGLHTLYRIPVLTIPVVGVLMTLAGGALVWAERA